MNPDDSILCAKCHEPLGRDLITLPYAQVQALRERIAQLEADAATADRTIQSMHSQTNTENPTP